MEKNIFLNGGEVGGFAGSVQGKVNIKDLVADKLRMSGIPVGDKVSSQFPWIRYTRESLAHGERINVRRAQWPSPFINLTPKLVKIDEIRMRLLNPTYNPSRPICPEVLTCVLAKMSISNREGIVEEWLPWHTLQTEMDRHVKGDLDSAVFTLPAPYFLQRAHPFNIDVFVDAALAAQYTTATCYWLALHGWGAIDGEPISLVKEITGTNGVMQAGGTWRVTFDEDRDRPLRDAWITHISIGAAGLCNQYPDMVNALFRDLRICPNAPEGPRWHADEFFPVTILSDQVGIPFQNIDAVYNYVVIHKPITPYILKPGEYLNVELWNRHSIDDFYVDVYARGTQEAAYV